MMNIFIFLHVEELVVHFGLIKTALMKDATISIMFLKLKRKQNSN